MTALHFDLKHWLATHLLVFLAFVFIDQNRLWLRVISNSTKKNCHNFSLCCSCSAKKSEALCLDIQTLKACNMLELVHLLLHISGSFHYCAALNTKQTLRSTYISLNHLYMLLCSLTLGCSLTNVVVLRFGTLLHHHFWSYWLFRRTFYVVEEGK